MGGGLSSVRVEKSWALAEGLIATLYVAIYLYYSWARGLFLIELPQKWFFKLKINLRVHFKQHKSGSRGAGHFHKNIVTQTLASAAMTALARTRFSWDSPSKVNWVDP